MPIPLGVEMSTIGQSIVTQSAAKTARSRVPHSIASRRDRKTSFASQDRTDSGRTFRFEIASPKADDSKQKLR